MMSVFIRHSLNPLITPAQVRPSRPDFEVIGAFNAGATRLGDDTLLLVRVAERPCASEPGWIACPYVDAAGAIALRRVRLADPDFDTRDPRVVRNLRTGSVHLTSISHLRLARSTDGVHFRVDEQPWLKPETRYETFGVEDARITRINDAFFVNYSAVSDQGIATGLVETADFRTLTRHGIIFPPSNRDVALFPQPVSGRYVCYHRPMPGDLGRYSIWLASSPDLVRWGDHRLVLEGSEAGWDSGRVGGGAPPIWTEHGWLSIYHAADRHNRYCLGAFLAAHDDPARVIARAHAPLFAPEADYETSGFFPNVVFTCGLTLVDGVVRLYYGAADDSIALAEAPLERLVRALIG
jgi:predicted GH43/DUF377 family glycosyl hydrolase